MTAKWEEVEAYAHFIAGQSVKKSAELLNVSESTISNYRAKMRKFMRPKVDIKIYSRRIMGLFPFAIRNLTQYILDGDKDVTIRFLESYGFLPKTHEDLERLMAAAAAGAAAGSAGAERKIDVGIMLQLTEREQEHVDGQVAGILGRGCSRIRLSPN